MQMKCQFRWAMVLLLVGMVSVLLSSCQTTPPAVIAVTGTMFGVEISQNPATQSPQAKIGYNRAELALVYKNGGGQTQPGPAPQTPPGQPGETQPGQARNTLPGQAGDVPNVLMEFGYGGTSANTIYQRLAIGNTAVTQSVATGMFLKNADGSINPTAATQIGNELKKIPTFPTTNPKP